MRYPVIAIVGRPNVGKSSLFNRYAGASRAIISDVAGTTRGSVDGLVRKKGMPVFLMVDTAGIMAIDDDSTPEKVLEQRVQEQVRYAIEHADVLLYLVDGQHPDSASVDMEAAQLVRRSKRPYLFVANKCDNEAMVRDSVELTRLGLGMPLPISVSHKRGLDDLDDALKEIFSQHDLVSDEEEEREELFARIALVGTPNVGKSALFNALVGEEKVIVSDVPGTTRDSHDTFLTREEKIYKLVDTAGIKRRGRIDQGIETFSLLRTQRAIARADVCLLVIDAARGITKQDMHVVEYVLEEKKGLIIVVNKWDLIKTYDDLPEDLRAARIRVPDLMEQYIAFLRFKFPFLPWASVVFTSAKMGRNVQQVFPQVEKVMASREMRLATGPLNTFLSFVIEKHKPTGTKAYIPRIQYATQVGVHPPHFVFFVNDKEFFHFSYARYLENSIREKYGFEGTPIIIELKNKKKKTYVDKD
ncbi:ribosome biogenesis GTPase Der [Candidatus Gracilibacteria bacterium CG17_big_fil_post_rev_8_21_14_2_50_48_13]|nr:MAG: ribosome biogenesis GTPase Der [Candidatus Gracilibacteria bacterium CG17_big_fil_post_rev_8_21_14_2_50_48_13]